MRYWRRPLAGLFLAAAQLMGLSGAKATDVSGAGSDLSLSDLCEMDGSLQSFLAIDRVPQPSAAGSTILARFRSPCMGSAIDDELPAPCDRPALRALLLPRESSRS
jgi:hypothetical protein